MDWASFTTCLQAASVVWVVSLGAPLRTIPNQTVTARQRPEAAVIATPQPNWPAANASGKAPG